MRLALYHEFDDEIPEEGDYNLGYFEGKKQAKKWLVSNQDLEAMYDHFQLKPCISLWCDGRDPGDGSDEEKTARKKKREKHDHGTSKRTDREEELEHVSQSLKGPSCGCGQGWLWRTHDDLDNPPKVPMITGSIQKQPRRESLTDAFTSAATAIAKAFSPPPIQSKAMDAKACCRGRGHGQNAA